MGDRQGNYGQTSTLTEPYHRNIGGPLLGGAAAGLELGTQIFGGLGWPGGLLSAGLGALGSIF